MNPIRILLVAGDPVAPYLQIVLRSMEYPVESTDSANRAMERFLSFRPSLSIVDTEIPDIEKVLDLIMAGDSGHPVILIDKSGSQQKDVPSPVTIPLNRRRLKDDFLITFSSALEKVRYREGLEKACLDIIGHSLRVHELRKLVRKAAFSTGPVLIRGENGTGKELVAKAVSSMHQKQVTVNCSAIPENLFESELFGHTKGSFTGATIDRIGLFEEASGGALFLDEIGDMPFEMQTKLLRALQEGEIRPVGSNQSRKVSVRILAATNRNLEQAIKNGRFREDLYYRINVIPVHVPPLRERLEDLEDLVPYFLKQHSPVSSHPLSLSDAAWKKLKNYDYPGNIRELENIMHRGIALAEGKVVNEAELAMDAPPEKNHTTTELDYSDFRKYLRSLEKNYIIQQLRQHGGSVKKTAEKIGMGRTALQNRTSTLEIDLPSIRKEFS